MSVTDRDQGYAALFKRLKGSKGLALTVGIHGPEGAAEHIGGKTPVTVADIATVHEYGLGNNPERSWLRAWVDENKSANEAILIKIGQGVVEGKATAVQGLDRAGLLFVGSIQKRIRGNIPPPLTPETVARKGSSTALIDTGQFWSSIRHKVGEDKGDE